MVEIIEVAMPKEKYKKMMYAQELILEYGEEISQVMEPDHWEKILDAFL